MDPSVNLSIVQTPDLIGELARRGTACVIGFITKDEDLPINVARMYLVVSGNVNNSLWLSTNLAEKAVVYAGDAGLSDGMIDQILRTIVYDPGTDAGRRSA